MNALTSAQRTLTPTQRARRSRILDAARQLVAQHGYDGMIMRDVASIACVSPTTLYNLYNTKDELLLEALRESVAEGWENAAQSEPTYGLNRLLAQLTASVAQTRAEPIYARAITQALFRANAGDQIVRVLVDATSRGMHDILSAMQDRGEIAADTQQLGRAMMGAYWAQYFLWLTGGLDLANLENELRRAFLSYLLPVAQGATAKRVAACLAQIQPTRDESCEGDA